MDSDAAAYIASVESADGVTLADHIAAAINAFVVGCKVDSAPLSGNNWNAMKACCLLAGAQTLPGIFVPLRGASPTNMGFVADDYDPLTGLKGDGVKYLLANRSIGDDPAANASLSVYVTEAATGDPSGYAGRGGSSTTRFIYRRNVSSDNLLADCNGTGGVYHVRSGEGSALGFIGTSRSDSSFYEVRANRNTTEQINNSGTVASGPMRIFESPGFGSRSDGRLSFYAIGEAVDLEALDHRVTQYMRDIRGGSKKRRITSYFYQQSCS